MTRVMRDELLEVTANLLESIARGVLDEAPVQRLVELAETPEERRLVDDVSAGGPTKVAAVTRLAEAMARRGAAHGHAARGPENTNQREE